MKKAIIIGASSGIGLELAKIMSGDGVAVGLAARRTNLLEDLRKTLPGKSCAVYMDISKTDGIEKAFGDLLSELGGVDLIVISSGTGFVNPGLDWEKEKDTVDVNVTGFMKVMNCAVKYFQGKGSGHIVGISSIGALRGGHDAPAYNASKAFISNYMEGIRCRMRKENLDITVTDIRPGLVDTDMAKGEGLFWLMPPRVVASGIYKAIKKKKRVKYLTTRWWIIAMIIKVMPYGLYSRL